MKNPFLLLILLPLFIGADTVTQLDFYSGSMNSAKQKANAEGKLYFVEFMANYCYLCKMMDETTWRDQKLVDYVEANYIPVKVNVDDFDGIPLKQKYNVKVLPTFLVFSSSGKLLGRYEESMSGSKMLATLKKYDLPENKTIKSAPVVSAQPKAPPKSPSRPTAEPQTPEKIQPKPPTVTATPEKPATASASPSASDKQRAAAKQNAVSGQGLYEFSVKKRESKGFGVQVGVFAQYGNVLKETEKLETKFQQPVLVNINTLNDQTVYRMIVGAFSTKAEAASYGKVMKSKGYTGIVKDLSQYK